jgi:hypothetical protein
MATIEQVRAAMQHAPFVVRLLDGRAFTVEHRDFCAVSGRGRGVTIYEHGRANHIDVMLIQSVDHADPGTDADVGPTVERNGP